MLSRQNYLGYLSSFVPCVLCACMCACACVYVHIDATFSLFPIEPPQVPLAAASRAVVQGSDKGM